MPTVQEAIKRLRYEFTSTGADKVASDLNKVGHAQQNLVQSSSSTERAQLSLDKQFANLERRYVTQVRAQQDYEKVQRQVNAAVAQNPALQERANVVMQAARQRYVEATQAVNDHGNAFEQLGSRLTRRLIYAALLSQVREVARAIIGLNAELAKTGDIAQRIGSGGQQFQGFSAAAGYKGLNQGAFADDMLKFNSEVDKARHGVGDLYLLLRSNGMTVADTANTFLKIADLVRNAASEAQKESILRQAGLPTTREFIRLMEQGAAAITKQASEAKKLTDQQLQDAQKLDDRWNQFWVDFVRKGKSAFLAVFGGEIIGPGPYGGGNRRSLAGGTGFSQADADAFYGTFGNRFGGTLTPRPNPTRDPAMMREQLSIEQQRLGILGNIASVDEVIRAKEAEIALLTKGLTAEEKERVLTRERILAQSQRLEFNLQFERQQLGRDPSEQRVYQELRTAGVAPGSAEGEGYAAMIRLNEQLRIGKDLTLEFAQGFTRDLRNGVPAVQALTNALGRLQDRLIDMALNKAISGIFGSLIGGIGGGATSGATYQSPTADLGLRSQLAHGGGMVGAGGTQRYVHPAYFDSAPRYHLGIDEVPAILQTGERVLNRQEAAAYNRGGQPIINFKIVNAGQPMEVQGSRYNEQGELEVFVDNRINGKLQGPTTNGIQKQKYGQDPVVKAY